MKHGLIKTLLASSLITAAAYYSTQAAPGDLYDGGLTDQKVYKFDSAGNRTVFVSGSTTFQPDSLAFDSKGNLFAANPANSAISKIPPNGSTITDFATGINPGDLAFDAAGNLFEIDMATGSIFKYTPSGARTTFAGPGIVDLVNLAFARDGNLFATRRGNGQAGSGSIVKFTPAGMMSTFFPAQPGGLFLPKGLAFDDFGNLYEADSGSGSIFKFAPNATKTTFKTGLNAPRSLAFDRNGNLFVGEFGASDIVKITPAGTLTPFASTAVGGLAFEPPTAQLTNISTRAFVQTGNQVLIAGFILTGTDPKQVIVRGLGPTLGKPPFNVPNALQNPVLELHNATSVIATNDDWQSAANANQIPTSPVDYRPPDSRESAILITLQPGAYTAIMSGENSTTGNGLVEVYDLATSTFSQLTNVSTRGFVGTNQNVMIGGFITSGGNGSTQIVIRGLGPTLGQPPFNVPNFLANPALSLVDGNGMILQSNNNWKDTQQAAIQAASCNGSTCAPPNDLEAAILRTVAPGNYTAILSGQNGGTGIGLVEIYKLR